VFRNPVALRSRLESRLERIPRPSPPVLVGVGVGVLLAVAAGLTWSELSRRRAA